MSQPLRNRTFVWTVDTTLGRAGWKPEGTDEQFYPGPGHLVAHDTIEHFGNAEGWQRELLAFGATMYGRMHTDFSMMEINASDFVSFFIKDQNCTVPKAKPQYYKPLPDNGKDPEGFLGAYMATIVQELEQRTDILWCFLNNTNPFDAKRLNGKELDEQLDNAAAWFRRGWLIAQRLHHKRDFNDLCKLVRNVTKAVDELTEKCNPHPGDKLLVSVNRAENTFKLSMV